MSKQDKDIIQITYDSDAARRDPITYPVGDKVMVSARDVTEFLRVSNHHNVCNYIHKNIEKGRYSKEHFLVVDYIGTRMPNTIYKTYLMTETGLALMAGEFPSFERPRERGRIDQVIKAIAAAQAKTEAEEPAVESASQNARDTFDAFVMGGHPIRHTDPEPVVSAEPIFTSNVIPFPAFDNGGALTMSSVEIAELTGKEHFHVVRDIRVLLQQLSEDPSKFGGIYKDSYGRDQECYHLPYDETMALITGYSAPLRMAVIKRWRHLEEQTNKTPNLEDPDVLIPLLSRYAGENRRLARQIEKAKPAVDYFERTADSKDLFSFDDTRIALKITKNRLRQITLELKWGKKGKRGRLIPAYTGISGGYVVGLDKPYTRDDGSEGMSIAILYTHKGKQTIADMCEANHRGFAQWKKDEAKRKSQPDFFRR